VSRKLLISDGTRERELQLVGRIIVGRDPTCDISHDHTLLSRRHAEIVTVGDKVVIRDLGSRNGVYVNGTRAFEGSLNPGDVVQIGPLRGRYILDTVPTGITPEELDTQGTVIVRSPVATAPTAPAPPEENVAPVPAPVNVPPIIERDEDQEVTRMVPAPSLPPFSAAALADVDDVEVTRFTAPPAEIVDAISRSSATPLSDAPDNATIREYARPSSPSSSSAGALPGDNDEVTRFTAPPAEIVDAISRGVATTGLAETLTAPLAADSGREPAPVPAPAAVRAPEPDVAALRSFVSVQVLVLGIVAFVAGALPSLMSRTSAETNAGAPFAMFWLMGGLGVAIVAMWIVGLSLNRRVTDTFLTTQRNRT
jgi:predicted component of type VI protein secretion system